MTDKEKRNKNMLGNIVTTGGNGCQRVDVRGD